MIDTDAYEDMTWETPSDELADAVENLLAEVERLREGYKKIARDYDFNAIISQGRSRMRPSLDVNTKHGVKVTYHQKACLRMMELFEND
tara:strand:+ start:59 stop:325 length:267 start_codon:yes stop_codon:yes gene_type:complete